MATNTDAAYGFDLSCVDDLDPMFPSVSGRTVLVQAIARRLTTSRGGLFYDPDYGLDIRDWLSEGLTPGKVLELEIAIAAQCRRDQRVESAHATCVLDLITLIMTVSVELTDALGPFSFVMNVSAATVTLLSDGNT